MHTRAETHPRGAAGVRRASARIARRAPRGAALLVAAGALLFVSVYPVAILLVNSFQVSQPFEPVAWGFDAWSRAFGDPTLVDTLVNTFSLGIVRVALAGMLGIFFAWVVTRTTAPFRRTVELSLWLGFFLPLLPLTFGWILLFDSESGLINTLLRSLFGFESGPLNLSSYWGIVWAHLAHSTAIMFLLVTPAFQRMDAALEEAAWTSGSGRLATLRSVTVPVLAPSIIVALILILIRSFESFEIELLLGAPSEIYVFSTKVWQYLRFDPPDYGAATALGVVFLAILVLLIVLQRWWVRRRDYTTVGGRGLRTQRADLGRWRWPTGLFSLGFVVIGIFLPMALLVLGTFMTLFGFFDLEQPFTLDHWQEVLNDPIFFRSLFNTLLLGLGAAIIGGAFYLVISYFLVRSRARGRQAIDFVTWLPWALPGVLIGLALLWMVLGTVSVLTFMYGTLYVLVLALIIKNLPLGVQMLKASVMQVGRELEESAYTSGAGKATTLRHIVFPLLAPGALTVALVVFIEAVREIPAVVFLASGEERPLSPLMLNYAQDGRFEAAAIIGLIISLVIVAVALAVRAIGRGYLLSEG